MSTIYSNFFNNGDDFIELVTSGSVAYSGNQVLINQDGTGGFGQVGIVHSSGRTLNTNNVFYFRVLWDLGTADSFLGFRRDTTFSISAPTTFTGIYKNGGTWLVLDNDIFTAFSPIPNTSTTVDTLFDIKMVVNADGTVTWSARETPIGDIGNPYDHTNLTYDWTAPTINFTDFTDGATWHFYGQCFTANGTIRCEQFYHTDDGIIGAPPIDGSSGIHPGIKAHFKGPFKPPKIGVR